MSKATKTQILTMSAIAIVLNIVLGMTVSTLKIPLLFLDTLGTITIAAMFGPAYGMMVGFLTNVLTSIIGGSISSLPFALVSIVIALIVGFIAKKRKKFDYKTALVTGLILSVAAPLIGTPIAVYMFGGLAGGGADLVFAALVASGKEIFAAAFITRIASNLVDKILSCLLAAFFIQKFGKDRATILD
ncbi:MAG: CD3073 family putative ECF transporter S component [Clostridia bacterium]